jgi:hypothetical protein
VLLLRTDSGMGIAEPDRPFVEFAGGREGLRPSGRSAEPVVHADQIIQALANEDLETFRPLLPVGYEATAAAYRRAAAKLDVTDLSKHYGDGLGEFQSDFVPYLKMILRNLSGGVWDFSDYVAYAAGSDVDFMTHILEAETRKGSVSLYPGDWFGFRVGLSQPHRAQFNTDSRGSLACLCVPSVRNGHLTEQMFDFLEAADHCLLNINLYPTLAPNERQQVAERLKCFLPKSVLSISFSRGFALTASQLGVVLVHPEHPFRRKYETQWNWFTYFFNFLAMRAFMNLNLADLETVDNLRREWVRDWLEDRELPQVMSGSYYVKSFRVTGKLARQYSALARDGLLRLCFKPPQTQ